MRILLPLLAPAIRCWEVFTLWQFISNMSQMGVWCELFSPPFLDFELLPANLEHSESVQITSLFLLSRESSVIAIKFMSPKLSEGTWITLIIKVKIRWIQKWLICMKLCLYLSNLQDILIIGNLAAFGCKQPVSCHLHHTSQGLLFSS